MNNKFDLIKIYRNYLFTLEERYRYGEKYGDTFWIIKNYEDYFEKQKGKKLFKSLYKK